MTNIDYCYFKKYLSKYNIVMFDASYRIAHFRYNNIIQKGGGKNNNLIRKIKNKGTNLLRIFIESLLENNPNKINWILTNI
jgi:hypothetical protein